MSLLYTQGLTFSLTSLSALTVHIHSQRVRVETNSEDSCASLSRRIVCSFTNPRMRVGTEPTPDPQDRRVVSKRRNALSDKNLQMGP